MIMTQTKTIIQWLDEPEDHNYPAAYEYLQLHFTPEQSQSFIQTLQSTTLTYFKAKDIFRASRLSLLGTSNFHVKKDLHKIESGKSLSPLLLVRSIDYQALIIADGYHRLCAVYSYDEDAVIPCKIV